MSYRVFARKYRPQTFEEVIGQEHITRTLQNAISQNRLAQAYLFVGPRGIGKTSTARILAKALNCDTGPTVNPCGKCDACREIAEGNSLDVLEIDGASNNSVEHVRELRENAAYQPARGPYKIYLVDEVHMLSTAAFNALLKTLEEPPPHVKFIFATTEAQKVPATITSRCQRFDLRRIPAGLIADHLQHIAKQEKVTLDEEAAETIAKGADGGLRDAESMLDQLVAFCGDTISADDVLSVFGFTARETVESLCGHLFRQDAAAALKVIEEQAAAGRDLARLMTDVIAHLRDRLVRATVRTPDAPDIPADRLLLLLDHFAETESRMRWAPDRRLVFDVAAIKAVHLLGEVSLSDVIDTLTAIGGGGELPPTRSFERAPAARVVAAPTPKSQPEKAFDVAAKPASADEEKSGVMSVTEEASAAGGGPESLWRQVAEELVAQSPIRFGWLADGVLDGINGDRVTVRFPASYEEHTEAPFWDDVRGRVEQALVAKLGGKPTFDCQFTEQVAEPVIENPEELDEPEVEPEPEPQPDPAADFKNDPLIRKAIELFKAKIEVS